MAHGFDIGRSSPLCDNQEQLHIDTPLIHDTVGPYYTTLTSPVAISGAVSDQRSVHSLLAGDPQDAPLSLVAIKCHVC